MAPSVSEWPGSARAGRAKVKIALILALPLIYCAFVLSPLEEALYEQGLGDPATTGLRQEDSRVFVTPDHPKEIRLRSSFMLAGVSAVLLPMIYGFSGIIGFLTSLRDNRIASYYKAETRRQRERVQQALAQKQDWNCLLAELFRHWMGWREFPDA